MCWQGIPKGVQHTQKYLHLSLKKSKIPPRFDIKTEPPLHCSFLSRSGSLQSNTMFHVGAFLLPLDGGVRNKFTCYIVQEKHFSRKQTPTNLHHSS